MPSFITSFDYVALVVFHPLLSYNGFSMDGALECVLSHKLVPW